MNIFELFETQALLTPDGVAVVTEVGEFSYGELLAMANLIRGGLSELGPESEQPIGVCMARSIEMIATMLAILASGCAYVPMDPESPPERLRRIIENSQCDLVVGDAASRWVFEGGEAGSRIGRYLDVQTLMADHSQADSQARAPGGDRRAYIMYTSGSTGIPKGVDTAHGGVVNMLSALRKAIAFSTSDRILAAATIGFDVSVVEIFLPLTSGGSLLLRDKSIWLSPKQLAQDVEHHGVTVVQASTSTWSVLLDEPDPMPHLRVAMNLGESISADLALRLTKHATEVWNMYGPTEGSVYSVIHNLSEDRTLPTRSAGAAAPIGTPIENVALFVVDDAGQPVGAGVKGELCVGGVAPARGYFNDEALTRQKFRFNEVLGERLYHTGDLGSYSDAGVLEFHGRMDDQLKIRGMRIEPGEVEAVLVEHAAIYGASVTWFENQQGERSVVAAVVSTNHDVDVLRQWLESRLAPQMIPAKFLFVDELPRAATGKIDRKWIRSQVEQSAVSEASPQPDADPTLGALGLIWQEILGVESVGPGDNFFSVGGDSLAAVRLVQAVEHRFSIRIPIQAIFASPNLARMARRIDDRVAEVQTNDAGSFIFPLVEAGSGSPLFFGGVDLKIAESHLWKVPCSLYAVAYWAQRSSLGTFGSLTELASAQLRGIREIQPNGPYRIAGYGFGGLVAYEIAQQLQREGHEVEALFLLDPVAPTLSTSGLRRVLGKLLDNKVGHVLTHEIGHLKIRKGTPLEAELVPKEDWPSLFFHSQRLASGYRPQVYDGPMALIVSSSDRLGDWQPFLGAQSTTRLLPEGADAMFEQPAMGFWMDDLAGRIGRIEFGPVPMTPNVCRYLARDSDLNHWNISEYFEAAKPLDMDAFQTALDALVRHHDTLRMSFGCASRQWSRRIEAEPPGQPGLKYHDLSAVSQDRQDQRIDELMSEINAGFDLVEGPLFDVSVLDLGGGHHRVLITTHHLLAEAGSLRILTEDLATGYEQARRGLDIHLPATASSVRTWANAMHELANSRSFSHKADFWRSLPWEAIEPIPSDLPGSPDAMSNSSARVMERSAPSAEVQRSRDNCSASAEELFLSSFAHAYSQWSGQTALLFDRIGNGRSPRALSQLDLSRISGFFLSYGTALLTGLGDNDLATTAATLRGFLSRDEEFDLTRWMSDDPALRAEFAAFPKAEVLFNFRGKPMPRLGHDSPFRSMPDDLSAYDHTPSGRRSWPVSIVVDEVDSSYDIRLIYSNDLQSEESITRLMDLWMAVLTD